MLIFIEKMIDFFIDFHAIFANIFHLDLIMFSFLFMNGEFSVFMSFLVNIFFIEKYLDLFYHFLYFFGVIHNDMNRIDLFF